MLRLSIFSRYCANRGVILIGGSSSIFMMGTSKDSMKEMIVLSFSLCRSSKGYGSFHIDKGKEKKQKNHYLYDSDYACTRSGT